MSRAKLARLTGNELSHVLEDEGAPGNYAEVVGYANSAIGMEMPVLSDAIRALLIMAGCTAKFVGQYWHVERRNGGEKPVGLHLRPGQKYRTQTGVPAHGNYEDWRKALNDFVGGLGE